MQAIVFDGTLRLETAREVPVPGQDEALLGVRRAGICNTDLEVIAGYNQFRGILGHEFVATVVHGPDTLIGRRVVGEINVTCGVCDFCRKGIRSQCRNRNAIGINGRDGAFAEFLTLPVRNLYPVSDSIGDDEAVFCEPLAAAIQVLESIQVNPHDRVVILGAGKLGLLIAQVISLTGTDVTVVARDERKRALLRHWGIPAVTFEALKPQSVQVVVEVTGSANGFADALALVEARGTIVLKSTFHGLPTADLTQVAVREIRIIGSRCGPFDAALRLLENRRIDVTSMIDGVYPLTRGLDAVAQARKRGSLKVLLAPNGSD